jgi:hypothetical protein
MSRRIAALLAGAFLAAGALLPAASLQVPAPSEGTFEGTWSVSGERHTMPTERNGTAAIVRFSGAVVLTAAGGLSRGFRGEVIGFDDGRDGSVGRWVWTDERGDRIFGTLKGDPIATGRRFTGAIAGGSGRYAGLTGDLEFSWQFVVAGEGLHVQGRTTGLKGRYRRGEPSP